MSAIGLAIPDYLLRGRSMISVPGFNSNNLYSLETNGYSAYMGFTNINFVWYSKEEFIIIDGYWESDKIIESYFDFNKIYEGVIN